MLLTSAASAYAAEPAEPVETDAPGRIAVLAEPLGVFAHAPMVSAHVRVVDRLALQVAVIRQVVKLVAGYPAARGAELGAHYSFGPSAWHAFRVGLVGGFVQRPNFPLDAHTNGVGVERLSETTGSWCHDRATGEFERLGPDESCEDRTFDYFTDVNFWRVVPEIEWMMTDGGFIFAVDFGIGVRFEPIAWAGHRTSTTGNLSLKFGWVF